VVALAALALLCSACASNTTEGAETGIAETEAGNGAELGDDEGGGNDGDGSDGADDSAVAATPAVDDGGSDAKQEAAETIADLPEADPAPNADRADVAPLLFGEPNDGAIEEPFGVDRWTFDSEPGQLIALDMLAIDHDCRQDLTMVLESPSGARGELGWVGNGGCRAHGPLELEEAGTYVVELSGGDGSVIEDTTGAYRILPLVLTERDVAAATFDQPLEGEISELLGVDRWSFDASEGDLLVVDVLAIDHDCRQDMTMTLEDPFGEREELDWVGNGGCKAHEPIEIDMTGPHTLEFHGGGGSVIEDATGSYRFLLSFLTELDVVEAAPDSRLDGEITQVFGTDRWNFDATEGQKVTIEILSIDHDCRQDLTMFIEDPFGDREEIGWVGNGGCDLYEPIDLSRTGTYAIDFTGGGGSVIEDNLGSYTFTFSLN
jgi:hypothetical protein